MLSEDELVDQVALLYIAGHETTVNLIGNGTLALLRHRDQLELLQHDPTLIVNGVDELLRFDSPVQFSRRITLADVEIDGQPSTRARSCSRCSARPTATPPTSAPTPTRSTSPPRRAAPPVVRRRHPPLPRRGARADRGPRRDRHPREALPAHGAGDRHAGVERPHRAAGPRRAARRARQTFLSRVEQAARTAVIVKRSTVCVWPPVEALMRNTGSVGCAKVTDTLHGVFVPPAGVGEDSPR